MKRIFTGCFLLASLFVFCTAAKAQTFELTCPAGTSSYAPLQSFNSNTGKYRQNWCIDSSGNVTLNAGGGSVIGNAINPLAAPYNVIPDGKFSQDGVTTLNSPTVSSATYSCISLPNTIGGDIGKVIWTTTVSIITGQVSQQNGIVSSCLGSAFISNNNSNATASGLNLIIGTEDGAGLKSAMNAAIAANVSLSLPSGGMVVSTPPFTGLSTPSNWNGSISLIGGGTAGGGDSAFFLNPNINNGVLTGGTFFYQGVNCALPNSFHCPYHYVSNIRLNGFSFNFPTTSGTQSIFSTSNVFHMENVQIENMFMATPTNFIWVQSNSGESLFNRMNFQVGNGTWISQTGQGTNTVSNSVMAFSNTQSPMVCNGGATCEYINNYVTGNNSSDIVINGANTVGRIIGGYCTKTSAFTAGCVQMTNASAEVSIVDYTANVSNATNSAFLITGGGTAKLHGNQITCGGGIQATCMGGSGGTGTIILLEDNTLLGGASFPVGVSLIAKGHSAKGACTGVATAGPTTLGLYGTGPNVTATTCTSATIGSGEVVQGSRTMEGLLVTASAAGVNASSGVVTVLKNGVATAATCTIGTGTSCVDNTHSVSVVDGDLISIQFTTQAAETLAGVKAIISWN